MTEIFDSNGVTITVGARVLGWGDEEGREVGTVTGLTDPDGDVNEYGRAVPLGPFVIVKYDDGLTEQWTARWNATGPWDDDRDDYTCDDVIVAREKCRKCGSALNADGLCADETCPYSDAPQSTEWDDDGYVTVKRGEGVDLAAVERLERYARGER